MKCIIGILLAFVLVFTPAMALCEESEPLPTLNTGNFMLTACEEVSSSPALTGYCLGFIHAIAEIVSVRRDEICIPSGVSGDQLKRVLMKYLQEHPALLHESDLALTVVAFREAFPCKK